MGMFILYLFVCALIAVAFAWVAYSYPYGPGGGPFLGETAVRAALVVETAVVAARVAAVVPKPR